MPNSAKRRLVLMLVCLATVLVTVVGINWIVNPYGVWRTTVVDRAYRLVDASVDVAGEHLSTPYRLRLERPTTLIVGSSRPLWGMLVAQGEHDAFLNASLSGATLAELAGVLRLASENPRLQRVIWAVEFYAFEDRFAGYHHPETRIRLEADERDALALQIKETLFNMKAFRDSRRVLARAARGHTRASLKDPVPWPEDLIRDRLAALSPRGLAQAGDGKLRSQLKDWINSYGHYRLSPSQIMLFQETVADLKRTGREVILFVPPLSYCELGAMEQLGAWDDFQQWKRELVSAGPYWDFSGYGKLDLSPELFADVPHFKPAVGQVILRRLLGMGCAACGERAQTIWNAGVWVEAATVEAHLARQEANRTAFRPRNTRCEKVVEGMLAELAGSASDSP